MDSDHGTQKTRLGFAVKLLFDAGIAHKDKRSNFKVEILDGQRKTLDKLGSRLLPGLQDPSRHLTKILWSFWSCWAWCAMRSSVEVGTSRGGRRYVASTMSSGRTAFSLTQILYQIRVLHAKHY